MKHVIIALLVTALILILVGVFYDDVIDLASKYLNVIVDRRIEIVEMILPTVGIALIVFISSKVIEKNIDEWRES